MSLTIKIMADCDVETAVKLQNAAHGGTPPEPHLGYQLKALCKHRLSFIALEDGKPCGYLLSEIREVSGLSSLKCLGTVFPAGETWFLYDLGVLDNFRSRGVGRALYEAAREAARRQGAVGVHLVSFDNARGFWEKLGLAGGPVMSGKF